MCGDATNDRGGNCKHQSKRGNLEVDQPRPPKGGRRAHEAEDFRQQPHLNGLNRLKPVAQKRKYDRKEGDKNHGPRYTDCSNGDANRQGDREHPPELKPVFKMHSCVSLEFQTLAACGHNLDIFALAQNRAVGGAVVLLDQLSHFFCESCLGFRCRSTEG
jgi:hypothetical protein